MARRLRVPSWLQSALSVKINGKTLDASASPGSYLTLSRVWKPGDRFEMQLPIQLRIEAMPDGSKLEAVLYGPVMLAGDLGTEGLTHEMISARTRRVYSACPFTCRCLVRASGADPPRGSSPVTSR